MTKQIKKAGAVSADGSTGNRQMVLKNTFSSGISLEILFKKGSRYLEEHHTADPKTEAWILLESVTGISRTEYFRDPKRMIEDTAVQAYEALLERRASGEPVQYLTGVQNFVGFDFKVSPDVLIPRQDTEVLVETVLPELKEGTRILDLCTGSGCILLGLLGLWAQRRPAGRGPRPDDETRPDKWFCAGTDISETSLAIAGENESRVREALGYPACFPEIVWVKSDLMREDPSEALPGCFDIVTANPPYIPSGVVDNLESEVKDHEPRRALDGGTDGLDFYRRIAETAGGCLKEGGRLFLEIGYDQGEAVPALLAEAGWIQIHVIRDLAGHDRVVTAVKAGTVA